ncbi:UNVERIFIED_CONTAM: hypothetical protein RF653_10135 [Kocuria sp. CPCC 205316]|uniref:hypothetical protein n=1 Tax=Kocuria TaxID=57493 RepID=UPI0036DE1F6F
MDLAPDWLSVLNFILVAFLGWKTLGPRRKTKINIFLDANTSLELEGKSGYSRLIVTNRGHFPARGLVLQFKSYEYGLHIIQIGDLEPWETKFTQMAFINHAWTTFTVIYKDADNKLVQRRMRLGTLFLGSREPKEHAPITTWYDKRSAPVWRPEVVD